jgi:hypothetical protein
MNPGDTEESVEFPVFLFDSPSSDLPEDVIIKLTSVGITLAETGPSGKQRALPGCEWPWHDVESFQEGPESDDPSDMDLFQFDIGQDAYTFECHDGAALVTAFTDMDAKSLPPEEETGEDGEVLGYPTLRRAFSVVCNAKSDKLDKLELMLLLEAMDMGDIAHDVSFTITSGTGVLLQDVDAAVRQCRLMHEDEVDEERAHTGIQLDLLERLRESWDLVDDGGEGVVPTDTLITVLKHMGVEATEDQVALIAARISADRTHHLRWTELLQSVVEHTLWELPFCIKHKVPHMGLLLTNPICCYVHGDPTGRLPGRVAMYISEFCVSIVCRQTARCVLVWTWDEVEEYEGAERPTELEMERFTVQVVEAPVDFRGTPSGNFVFEVDENQLLYPSTQSTTAE